MTLPDNLPTTFFDANFFAVFEGYVRWFLKYNMPIFMLVLAAGLTFLVLDMIMVVPKEAKDALDDRGRRRKDNDDEDD